jgi:hypothetical protein
MTRLQLALLNALRRNRPITLHVNPRGWQHVSAPFIRRAETMRAALVALHDLARDGLVTQGRYEVRSSGRVYRYSLTEMGRRVVRPVGRGSKRKAA